MRAVVRLLALATLLPAVAAAHAQWELEDSGTTASLRGIHNVGGGVAWASGTDGTVVRTEDGGYLWQGCAIPPGAEHLDFRGVQAFDENTAIVMSSGPGDQSRLYKTTDGCRTWKLVFTNPDKDGFWDALKFSRSGFIPTIDGVLLGDPVQGRFGIFVTSDKGESWRRWEIGGFGWKGLCGERAAKSLKGEGIFAASNGSLVFESLPTKIIFITGGTSGARVVASDYSDWDGPPCSTSFDSLVLLPQGPSSKGAFATAASSWDGWLPKLMVVVGGDYAKPDTPGIALSLVQRTGFHIPFQSYFAEPAPAQTPPHGYRSSVAYDPTTKTWITVGPNGSDFSADDGRNWHPLGPTPEDQPGSDRDWNALSLPFVVGPHGRIGRLRTDALPGQPTPAAPKPKPSSAKSTQ